MATCGLTQASCKCIQPKDHDGPHACECGGRWDFTKDGGFCIVALPGGDMDPFELAAPNAGVGTHQSASLLDATSAYQNYVELRRLHAEQFDDKQFELLDEDIARARRAMEVAWLEAAV